MGRTVKGANVVSGIRQIEPSELWDPGLRAAADRMADSVIFAGQKALAHVAAPAGYPQPENPMALERLFLDLFRELPDAEVSEAARRALTSIRRSPLAPVSAVNRALFERVELGSAEEVEVQLARLSPEFGRLGSAADVPANVGGTLQPLMGGGPLGGGKSSLRWRLRRLDCNEETGLTAAGSDRVFIGGVAVDAFGNAVKVPVQDLGGGWDTGNHEVWPDRTLTTFDFDYGTGWPRPSTLILAISVRSSGGLWELLDRIVDKAKDEVIKYAAAAAGAVAGAYIGGAVGSLGGPLGTVAGAIVGAVVGYVVGYVIDKLWSWLKSQFTGTKLFQPVSLVVDVPFHGSDFGGSLTTDSFHPWWKGHYGKYTATVDAVLEWGPAAVPSAVSQGADKLDLFRVDSKANVQGTSWGKHSAWKWTVWSEVQAGRTTADAPIGVAQRKTTESSMDSDLLDLFMVGFDGRVWTAARESTGQQQTWGGWWPVLEDRPDRFVLGTRVTGVSRDAGCLDVFATGMDWTVKTAAWGTQTQSKWRGWWAVGQGSFLPGTPIAAVCRSANVLDVFAIGLDGRVWSAAWGAHTQGEWNGWFPILEHVFLPGRSVTVVSRKKDHLDLFAVDGNGEVRTAAWSLTGNNGKWGGWWRVTQTNGQFAPGTPVAAASQSEDQLDLFAVGLDGRVWTAAWGPQTGHQWAGWWPIGEHHFVQGAQLSATARRKNQLDVFVNGLDGNIWSAAWDGDWRWIEI